MTWAIDICIEAKLGSLLCSYILRRSTLLYSILRNSTQIFATLSKMYKDLSQQTLGQGCRARLPGKAAG
jgi:hypothetical protein